MNSQESTPIIISALTASDDSNRLRYSADGNFVILRTRIGDMNLTSNEFTHYQLLFKIADINNTGRLTSSNSHLATLLSRTKLSTIQLDTILSHVNGRTDVEGNEVQGLSFNQWLVLCRLIAHTQSKCSTQKNHSYIPNEDALEEVHIAVEQVPICDFSFGKCKGVLPLGFVDEFACEVKGYKVHGDGFQQHHIKFTIQTVTNTTSIPQYGMKTNVNGSVLTPALGKSTKQSKKDTKRPSDSIPLSFESPHPTGKKTTTTIEVIRRFSDFELLAGVLQRFYPRCIIPPLPPKSWGFNSVSDEVGIQRSRELQMFLNHITTHPFLRHTYEVKAFLEASAAGFRAFRDFFPRLHEGITPLVFFPSTLESRQSSKISTMLGSASLYTAAAAATTSALVAASVSYSISQSKSLGFMSQWLGNMKNSLTTSSATVTHSVKYSSQDQKLQDILKLEEGVGAVASRFEQVMMTEGKMIYKLSQFGYYLKQMADYGTDVHNGGADVDLQNTCHHIEMVVETSRRSLDDQIKNSLSPMQYMGRYVESLRTTLTSKELLSKQIDEAAVKEEHARKALDQAKTSMTQSDMVTSILDEQLEDASQSLNNLKKIESESEEGLLEDLVHLSSVTTENVQRCSEAFVVSRIESCERNVEILEKLRQLLLDSKSWRPEVSGILLLDEFV